MDSKDRKSEIQTGPVSLISTTGLDWTGKFNNRTGPNFDNRTNISNRTGPDRTGQEQKSAPVAQEPILVQQESILVAQ